MLDDEFEAEADVAPETDSILDPAEGSEALDVRAADEDVAEEPGVEEQQVQQQPEFTPQEHGLYRRIRREHERFVQERERNDALAKEIEALRASVDDVASGAKRRQAAEEAAAAMPSEDDPLGQLTYGLQQAVSPKIEELAKKVGDFGERLAQRDKDEAAAREQQQKAWVHAQVDRARQEVADQMQQAPEAVRGAVEGTMRSNYELMLSQGLTHEEALARISDGLVTAGIQAAQLGMGVAEYFAKSYNISVDDQPSAVAPTPSTSRDRLRAKAPTNVTRGESAPAASEASSVRALAKARLAGKYDQEQVEQQLNKLARTLKTDPMRVQDAVAREMRSLVTRQRATA